MMFILLSVVCLHLLSSAAEDPCLNYESLINDKRSALYQPAAAESNICDEEIDESVWYRFKVLPPHRIHDQCVPELHCGTEQPLWINGEHPTAEDPGPKTVKVCSPRGDDCCGGWETTILVKFCPSAEEGDGDGFYVYRLKRVPQCEMAYCAGNSVVCTGESVWNPVRKECTEVRPNITTPVLEGPKTVKKFLEFRGNRQEYDDFYFECVVRWTDPEQELKTGGEQFEVIFTFDGKEVEKVPPKITDNSNLRVKLTSRELIEQVGKTVGCQVRSYWLKLEKFKKEYLVSERTYFVGIRYSLDNTEGSFTSQRIEIDESLPALTLYFQATVPISCPVIEGRTTCKITIKMEDSNNGLGLSSCNMVFSGLEMDSKPKIQRVKALPTPGIHQRTSVIRFRAISTNPEFFWHGYKLPDISIFIKDSSTTGSCSSWGDPHITTFDGRYYDAYMEGDYLFARSTSPRHFEVHVRHHKCWAVTCNCAVAVREGNNVLGVNACQGPNFTPTPIVYLSDKHVPGATITNAGNVYTITMPSGAYVRMEWYGLQTSIYLYLNSEDYGKVIGLCGTFNGVAGDDTVPKGDHQVDTRKIPVSFTESYKLAWKESFINGHVHPIDCLEIKEQVPNICSCQDKEAIACSAPAVKTATFDTQFTQHCNPKHPNEVPTNLRRFRRSMESNETSLEDDGNEEDEVEETETEDKEVNIITEADIPLPEIDENHGRAVVPAWPTPSGISEADARRLCRSQVEASPVYAVCRDQISQQMDTLVTSCVTDIQISDDVNLGVNSILDDFQTQCVHKLETSVVRNDTDDQSPPSPVEQLLKQVVANICPAQCNGNGTCSNGTCICNDGFAGDDCSINTHNPPTLTSFRKDSVCDGRSTFCSETSIFASNIFQSEKLLCKVNAVDANRHFAIGGSLVSTREVMCRLPSVHRFTKADGDGQETEVGPAPLYRWDIALTNDGSLYSNSLRLTVYDSKCQECRTDGTCVQKEETCVIGGRCFLYGDRSKANPCEKCVPSRSRHEWTFLDKSECMKDSSAPWFSYSIKVLTIVTAFTIGCFVG